MAEKEGAGTDLLTDLSPDKEFPSYVLYKCQINRTRNTSSSSTDEGKNKDGESKKTSSTPSFSLSVVTSGLNQVNEEEFDRFITKRLSKSGFQSYGGHISGFELSTHGQLLCYYTLLKGESIEGSVGKDSSPTPDSPTLTSPDISNEYLVCLIAPADAVLDLFRPELDGFCRNLLSLLDADLSTVATKIQPYLKDWFYETTQYLCRSVKLLKSSVKYIIYAALSDSEIDITGANEKETNDIRRFMECCSLAEVVNSDRASSPEKDKVDNLLVDISVSDPSGKPISPSLKPKLTLSIQNDSCTVKQKDCTKFCEDWANSLLGGDTENPVFLRQVIDNYKLKAIQDLNNLKRLLRQAETDHYALYRCFVFLKSSGNSPILLQHVPTELSSVDTSDAMNILRVLEEFIGEQTTKRS